MIKSIGHPGAYVKFPPCLFQPAGLGPKWRCSFDLLRQIWRLFLPLGLFLLAGCGKEPPLRLVYNAGDYNYSQTAELLKKVLLSEGYQIQLVPVENAIEGARMVANGDAEFSMIMDQTDLEEEIGENIDRIRTVVPLFRRVIYIFFQPDIPQNDFFTQMIRGRRIYAGPIGGEKYLSFQRFMKFAGFSDYTITTDSSDAEAIFFWGDTNGQRAELLAKEGWKVYDMRETARHSIRLRLGRLSPFDLPPTHSMGREELIRTMSSNVLLITSDRTDQDRTYDFAEALFNARPRMIVTNPIYEQMIEDFDTHMLPYPLSEGMEAYLRRDEPTFWERYAELIALAFGVLATISGVIQSIRLWIHRRRKERLDDYLREFADARAKPHKEELLAQILNKALDQLTRERLEKEDFDLLARLIYSEITTVQSKDEERVK